MVGFMGVFVCSFFFFQAEDGIRDKLVTGVQTCALPIYDQGMALALRSHLLELVDDHVAEFRRALPAVYDRLGVVELDRIGDRQRSEERRVGKECRSGCCRSHSKDKYNLFYTLYAPP